MKLLVIENNSSHMSLIEYIDNKVTRTFSNGFSEYLYTNGDDYIYETKTPSGKVKRIRIPCDLYFSLCDMIPALNYFDGNLVPDTVMLDGTEVVTFKNKK